MASSHNIPPSAAKTGEATKFGVGILNLHVMITNDDGSWFAQALEIDYAVQGESLEDVKAKFQAGLCNTVHAHLKMHGSIKNLVAPAPAEVWQEIAKAAPDIHEHSQVSFHELEPIFKSIEFLEMKKAA
jgi:hypothetical protein